MGIANALKQMAVGSFVTSRYDDAIRQSNEALAIYEKTNNLKGRASVVNNLANIKSIQGDFDAALTYYQESVGIRKKFNDLKGIAICYDNIGNTYSAKGDYYEALFYLFKALRIREKLNNQLDIANSLSGIASVYYYLGKHDALLIYARRSLKMHEKIGNKDGMIQALIAIGAVYFEKKDKDALIYFSKALKLSEEMNSPHSIVSCLNNLGAVYSDLHHFEEAKQYYERSLIISEENGDQENIAISHIGIADVLMHFNRSTEATKHLLAAVTIATDMGSKLILLQSTQSLAEAYEMQKDYRNMALCLQKVITYKDSLINDEVTKKSQQLEFNFILHKKQKEIALLAKDSAIQKGIAERRYLVNISLAAVLLLSFVFAFALWRSVQKVHKANAITIKQKEEISRQADELKTVNTLKDKIFSVLSHDLRSPIASLTGIMELMDHDMITPEEFSEVKDDMNNQLSALGLLLDNLLFWSRSQLNGQIIRKETINIAPLIEQNLKLLDDSAKQKNISLVFNASPNRVNVYADINHADIVIRNLISNAIKFTNPNGKVEVNTQSNENTITISVKDNGIGIDPFIIEQMFTNKLKSNQGTSGEKGTGLGLLLCKDFAEQNDGKLSVTSKPGEGSIFYFTLPKV